jgi:hypothetical protein
MHRSAFRTTWRALLFLIAGAPACEPSSSAPTVATPAPSPCDGAPFDPMPVPLATKTLMNARVQRPLATTDLRICLESCAFPKTEDGHVLVCSASMYDAAGRIEPSPSGTWHGYEILVTGIPNVGAFGMRDDQAYFTVQKASPP